jgi:hypothetical protein
MTTISTHILPHGDSVFFGNWTGPDELPSPEEVRAHHDVLDRRAAVVVRFLHLKLVVKYGHKVRATEGQALWVIEHYTDLRAPIVYGWFQDGDEMFLYMSLVDGVTLEKRWPEMSKEEKDDVSCQLQRMLASVRTLQSPSDEIYIGRSRCPLATVALIEFSRIPWTYPVS